MGISFWNKRSKNNQEPTAPVVTAIRNSLFAEEFPEGPYGADLLTETLGKSTPWREGQYAPKAYSYADQELHAGIPRAYPGADDELGQ